MGRWGSVAGRPANLNENFQEAVLDWLTAGGTTTPDVTPPAFVASAGGTKTFLALNASASGVTTLIAATPGKSIRVVALALVANGAVNVKFQSHVTPTDITGLYYLAANGGFVLPEAVDGWFKTVAGEALDINLSAAVAVGGSLVYDLI